jgi:hypothetical protein
MIGARFLKGATMAGQLRVNLTPNGFLLSGAPITVSSEEALDPKSAQGAIILEGQRADVVLTDDSRTAEVRPEGELLPGPHRLLIGELLTADGKRLGDPFEVPFLVIDSAIELPNELLIDHITRIRVEEFGITRLPIDRRPEGPFIDLLKATVRDSEEPIELALDEHGRRIDAGEILVEVAKRRAERFGRIHEALDAHLERAAPDEPIPVAIWVRLPEGAERPDKPTDRSVEESPREERRLDEVVGRAAGRLREIVAREYGDEDARADEHAPVVYARLQVEPIRALARRDDVAGLFLYEPEGVNNLTNSMAAARSDSVQQNPGLTGRGINVAVWEDGPDVTTNLQITAQFTNNPTTDSHARHTHGIIKNIEANRPHGHAPDCNLHSANSKDLAALRWAVRDRGCTVVSQSFHRSSEPGSSGLSFDDIYKDWLVLRWPYPTILQAAGNYWTGDPDGINPPSSEYANHKGYNSLAIGNHNDTAGAMAGDSVFRNPATSHGDRELPELSANGTAVTTVGLTMSGTSMAAPAAAGCTALLQQADATLCSWPEGCRAILLAGANRNPSGGTWWNDVVAHVDASDGSGALDVLEGVRIAQSRRHRNDPASRRGWDVGTFRSGDFDGNRMSTFVYRVAVPATLLGPKVKVALAWDGEVQEISLPLLDPILISSTLTVDFDLLVRDAGGSLIGNSSSWDNSYEIAEFAAATGQTYEIRIRRWSGTNDTWYGIAWTVTGREILPPVSVD